MNNAQIEFLARVKANKDVVKDNSKYPAGSPMRWWCQKCGAVTESRPEGYNPRDYDKPKKICDACQRMIDEGPNFPSY